jgi:3-isopropylmalate/(R)-2-methylmalate dehydratase large subunit
VSAPASEDSYRSTLYGKIWDRHIVLQEPGLPAILYADVHLVHEGTFLQAFEMLRARNLPVRRLPLTVSTTDHFVPSRHDLRFQDPATMPYVVKSLMDTAVEFGMTLYGPNEQRQGIVHVIGPELGLTQPGIVLVCADSHTSTHGALGALAFGIGTTEVGHTVATQTLLQRRQKTMRVTVDGELAPGVYSKDVALALMAENGTAFGRGHVIEFAGPAVRAMSIEARMSLCNMSIEMGSRSGLVAPDEVTFAYLKGREFAPTGAAWDHAVEYWAALASEPDAVFDTEISINASEVEPMITYGTSPGMAIGIQSSIPDPARLPEEEATALAAALDYMALRPGDQLIGQKVDTVFIGSCTNSRIEDMRAAASVLKGRSVAGGTVLKIVPGSQAVKRQAEAEGLDEIFTRAGAQWGEPSCSLCVAVNGDVGRSGEYVASTSNRNFQGRQGPGVRTLLMSPMTAAATAVHGAVADPRPFLASV